MPEGKRPLGRPRRRWVVNIKMDLRGIGWDIMDWIDLAQNSGHWRALVNTVMNPSRGGSFLYITAFRPICTVNFFLGDQTARILR
jgi:hypothetical protein